MLRIYAVEQSLIVILEHFLNVFRYWLLQVCGYSPTVSLAHENGLYCVIHNCCIVIIIIRRRQSLHWQGNSHKNDSTAVKIMCAGWGTKLICIVQNFQ